MTWLAYGTLMPTAAASADGDVGCSMRHSLHIANLETSGSLHHANDLADREWYTGRVNHSRPKRYTNWYLRAWMKATGVTQAVLISKTNLSKTAVSLLVNDRQDYTPEIIRDVALALNVAPHELLMDPEDAMALRALRQDALRVVEHGNHIDELAARRRTGTEG